MTLSPLTIVHSHSFFKHCFREENDLLDQIIMGQADSLNPICRYKYALYTDLLKDRKSLPWDIVFFTLIELTLAFKAHPNFDETEAVTALIHSIQPYKGHIQEEFRFGTAMHHAAYHNLPCLIRALQAYGSLIETAGFSPLHVACSWNHFEAAEQLLRLGANVHAQFRGVTPLLAAAESPRIIKLLIDYGAVIDYERKVSTKFTFFSQWTKASTAVESAVRKEAVGSLGVLIAHEARISPNLMERLKVIILVKIVDKVQDVFSKEMKVVSFARRVSNLVNILHLLNHYESKNPSKKQIIVSDLTQAEPKKKTYRIVEAIGQAAAELAAENWLDKEKVLRKLTFFLLKKLRV